MKELDSIEKFISYNNETGIFSIIKKTGPRSSLGPLQVSTDSRGYQQVQYMGKAFLAHRLAWYFTHGKWPENEIDHINGVKTDNRIANLREATRSQNIKNRGPHKNIISGLKGVYFNKARNKYQAAIWIDGKRKALGVFEDKYEAFEVYKKAARERDGDFFYEEK